MKRICSILTIIFVIAVSILPMVAYSKYNDKDLKRIIVVFDSTIQDSTTKDKLIEKFGGTKLKDLDLINASVAFCTEGQKKSMLLDKNGIIRIEDDIIAEACVKPVRTAGTSPTAKATPIPTQTLTPTSTPTPTLTPTSPTATSILNSQEIPWGIQRIHADTIWSSMPITSVKIAIIDSGIDLDHPDLKANIKGGYNAIKPSRPADDDYGHGTHIAGIVSAVNNSIGIVGVAPKSELYAVKVLDSQGNGYLSDIIEGIDWSIKNNMDIINMSFGIANSQSLHDAIIRANSAGIIQVSSAGNTYGGMVTYPAAYSEVISVSSTDINNSISSFSSTGKVDLCAPGVDIYSTFKNSSYTFMSGTSMSAAHVSGVAALLLAFPQICDLNSDGVYSPSEVQNRLKTTSIDLGIPGDDSDYGAGLVDAYNVVYY